MKKFFTNLRNRSENNEGFSLVELIIVIAIMVALVAMLAPQFTKYVSKSRDAVITRAAEDVLSVAKSEYALGHLRVSDSATDGMGRIRVQTDENGKLIVVMYDLEYDDGENAGTTFVDMCGLDQNQVSKSPKAYIIKIKSGTFSAGETQAVFSEEVTDDGHSAPEQP